MNRRGFLKGMIALAAAPAIVRADSIMHICPLPTTLRAGDFTIDPITGNVRYIGKGRMYSILDFHRILQSRFEKPDAMVFANPSIRFTDQLMQLPYPYNIDDKTAKVLHGGSIRQENALFSGISIYGDRIG